MGNPQSRGLTEVRAILGAANPHPIARAFGSEPITFGYWNSAMKLAEASIIRSRVRWTG